MPRLCVLGSGSSGNSTWVSLPAAEGSLEFLIDAGLTPKATLSRLATGASRRDVPPLLLVTHLDTDHFRPTWVRPIERLGMRVIARGVHLRGLAACGVPRERLVAIEPDRPVILAPGVELRCERAPHDLHGSTAFRVDSEAASLGWITDTGRATPALLDLVRGCDLLGIESNYCPKLQLESPRPAFLKRRIMGGAGHLSNEECLEAIRALHDGTLLDGPLPSRVVLLHLSRQCNDPAIVERLWRSAAPEHWPRVTLSNQERPTPVLAFGRGAGVPATLPLFP